MQPFTQEHSMSWALSSSRQTEKYITKQFSSRMQAQDYHISWVPLRISTPPGQWQGGMVLQKIGLLMRPSCVSNDKGPWL